MLSIRNLTYQLGARTLYEDVNLHVQPNDRIGLVGPNGAGKSTLFRLIMKQLTPDKGSVQTSNDYTIGWLHQDLISYESQGTIRQVATEGLQEIKRLQQKMDTLAKQIEVAYSPSLVEELIAVQETFAHQGGYEVEGRAEKVLLHLGFAQSDLDRPFSQFSGGWRMRALLAKLLVQAPNLLLLDEPTNHLDIETIRWLEEYLRNYPKELILISHDRALLDAITNKTVEVYQGTLRTYAGNYTFYEQEQAVQREVEENTYKNQEREVKHMEKFIERFRSKASKARQVQSRIKSLEKLQPAAPPTEKKRSVNFRFEVSQKPGKVLLTLNHVGKSYGALELFRDTTATLERGDKAALIGANGKGKSTLLQLLAGEEAPTSGTIERGHQVTLGYYTQHQLDMLRPEHTVLEALQTAAPGEEESTLRRILGNFLFRKEEVYKKIAVLSGGEKARVALAKTLLQRANTLLLDEPTNHLDIASQEVLTSALQAYSGSFVLISHDRYFIRQIANKIWYIEDQQLKVYPGCYDEYLYAKGR